MTWFLTFWALSLRFLCVSVVPYLSNDQAEAATKNVHLKLLFRLSKFFLREEESESYLRFPFCRRFWFRSIRRIFLRAFRSFRLDSGMHDPLSGGMDHGLSFLDCCKQSIRVTGITIPFPFLPHSHVPTRLIAPCYSIAVFWIFRMHFKRGRMDRTL